MFWIFNVLSTFNYITLVFIPHYSILKYWEIDYVCPLSSYSGISSLISEDSLTHRSMVVNIWKRAFVDVASGTLLNMTRILILRATFQRHRTQPRDGLHGLLLSLVVCATTVFPTPRCCSSSHSRFMFMFYGSFILNLWRRAFHRVLWFRGCKRSGRFMPEIGIKIGVAVRTTPLHRQPFIENVNCKRW